MGLIGAAVALVVISLPLVWRANQNIANNVHTSAGAPIVEAWIGDRDLDVVAYIVDGETVVLHLAGEDPRARAGCSASAAFGTPVDLEVDYEAIERYEATGP